MSSTNEKPGPLSWLFGLCAVQESSGSAVLRDTSPELKPLAPSVDPWYNAPAGFEAKSPGDILRIRPAPGDLDSVISNAAAAYHILYRTTDSRYKPSWAVTTLIVPQTFYFAPSGKAALLSYQFAYNTANVDGSPSFGLFGSLAQANPQIGVKSGTSLVEALLSEGWIVNTPDYLGPSAAFGASVQAGHATLDSVRAILNLASMTGSTEMTATMWGYSGGSIATMAAAELQPRYAPDLKISGTVAGGLMDNVSTDFESINKTVLSGSFISFLLGLTAQYPEARAYLESCLVPETKDEFLSVKAIEHAEIIQKFAGKDIFTYFKGGALDLQAPIMVELYNAQTKLGYKGVPTMPMFVYKAIADQFGPTDQTDVTVNRLCSGGADVTYERNTVGEHVSEIENGKARAIKWLWSIFDGSYKPSPSGCIIRDVSVDVSAEAK